LSEVKDLLFVFRQIRHKSLVILNGAAFSGVPSDRSSSLGWLSEVKDLLFVFRLIRHKCLVILNGAVFSGVPATGLRRWGG
jgi:hypothetical protein